MRLCSRIQVRSDRWRWSKSGLIALRSPIRRPTSAYAGRIRAADVDGTTLVLAYGRHFLSDRAGVQHLDGPGSYYQAASPGSASRTGTAQGYGATRTAWMN